ncbi:DUF3237 domain-containing protein [Antarcticimicrobium luteum]|uniref:UPF0311 protein E1832_13630 n=1 Tax=Antarcticimicrobium luteum TaxID=2547397 RepID=A0A4V3AR90_9RHOB|nr:DUF3237 domain-containing protein [Antarcticimicrobium luteum]TDK45697.1 DUF3237 domain-containing protein [Antarcticimicrobium luteum]
MTDWTIPRTTPLAVMTADLGPPQSHGETPRGNRKIVPVTGGTVEGRINGRILPFGGDWALTRTDGVLELDVRLTIETSEGALIHVTYAGMRHGSAADLAALARGDHVPPERLYFRILPRFETSAPAWLWLNRILCVGYGERLKSGPRYHLHEIL